MALVVAVEQVGLDCYRAVGPLAILGAQTGGKCYLCTRSMPSTRQQRRKRWRWRCSQGGVDSCRSSGDAGSLLRSDRSISLCSINVWNYKQSKDINELLYPNQRQGLKYLPCKDEWYTIISKTFLIMSILRIESNKGIKGTALSMLFEFFL